MKTIEKPFDRPSRRHRLGLVALMAALCALAFLPVTRANAAASGPRTWHVLVGGQSDNAAIQAEKYYPHVITIDVGDTVV